MLGRIIDTLGTPPTWMLESARHAGKFFKLQHSADGQGGRPVHVLLTREEFEARNGVPVSAAHHHHDRCSLP